MLGIATGTRFHGPQESPLRFRCSSASTKLTRTCSVRVPRMGHAFVRFRVPRRSYLRSKQRSWRHIDKIVRRIPEYQSQKDGIDCCLLRQYRSSIQWLKICNDRRYRRWARKAYTADQTRLGWRKNLQIREPHLDLKRVDEYETSNCRLSPLRRARAQSTRGNGGTIQGPYWWEVMKQDVREFTQACIHWIVFRIGERIQRPLATAIYGDRANEVVHRVISYIGPAEGSNMKYWFLIKDHLSFYTGLHRSDNADSDAAMSTLSKWIGCFGCMGWLETVQGSHFIASLMTNLTKEARILHPSTTPYCPWSNVMVERQCKNVLRITNVLLSDCSYLQYIGQSSVKPFKSLSISPPWKD